MVEMITTRGKAKAWSWSYSKLKNFETCPKRHWHVDIKKDFKEEEGESLQYGNAVHKALADAVSGKAPLPKPFEKLQKWVDRVGSRNSPDVEIVVEQKLAINADFAATGYFDNDVWYRAVVDVAKFSGPIGLAVDWKTGKIIEDGSQLALNAACVFAHYPQVQKIRTEFIWLKEDATSRADFSRDTMAGVWAGILPRVQLLKNAADAVMYPPKPGGLCKRFCPVTACPHNGV
jgi:hypothetical protein